MSSSPVPGRLSVITPVFNGEEFLEETLLSLVASDYEDIEFILVDDGSTDSSLSIAKRVLENSGRNHRIISKPNSGEADSDNVALAASSGEFIANIDADNRLPVGWIDTVFKEFGRSPNIVAVISRGNPQVAHTSAARAGVIALTKSVSTEWAQLGIRANCLAPGSIATEGLNVYPRAAAEAFSDSNPMRHLGDVIDIAQGVVYLGAQNTGKFVTGELLVVDGGRIYH